jgi:hypothetical protein
MEQQLAANNLFKITEDPLGAVQAEIKGKPIAKRKSHRPGPAKLKRDSNKKHINKELVAEMINQGYKAKVICDKLQISPATVSSVKSIIEKNIEDIETFKNFKSSILEYRQKDNNLLSICINRSLEKDLLDNKLRPADKINWLKALDVGFSIYFDKLRLQEGKATQHIAVLSGFMKEAISEV